MATNIVFNGATFSIPAEADSGWGDNVSNYLIAIASGSLQKTGGSFNLLAEVDFGTTYGLKTPYVKSRAANPSATGQVRLGNTESISWRNAANSADIALSVNAANQLTFNSNVVVSGLITDADVSASAAIAYSKLNLSNSIVNADINSSANIDYSKLANLPAGELIVGNASNRPTAMTITGDITFDSAGVTTYALDSISDEDISTTANITYTKLDLTGQIQNSDIESLAGISRNKLAALTGNRAMVTDASGFDSWSTTTDTEIGYVSGVTSNIQTQLNDKAPSSTAVTLTGTQTLTNKDYDGGTASNSLRLTVPKNTKTNLDALTRKEATIVYGTDTDKLYVDDGTNLIAVGSGSGSGNINYILNPDAEQGTVGYATYADAAGIAPVDGTGGSPTVTLTASNSLPLVGTNSLIFDKLAGSAQGQGFSYDFTIDKAYQGQMLQINYLALLLQTGYSNGTGVNDSDVLVYVYDKTNGTLIYPSAFKVIVGAYDVPVVAQPLEFQTAINSTSYRLIFHVATTNAAAWTLKLDNFSVGPTLQSSGVPSSDWTSYTPSFQNLGTPTAVDVKWRQNGPNLEIQGRWTNGTVAGGSATWSMPPGLSSSLAVNVVVGDYGHQGSATGSAVVYSKVNNDLRFGMSNWAVEATGTQMSTAGFTTVNVSIPIAGWQSNTIMSQPGSNSEVITQVVSNANQALTANVTDIIFSATPTKDTTGSWNGTTTYKVPVNGDYTFMFCGYLVSGGAGITIYRNGIISNGVTQLSAVRSYSSAVAYNLRAGDLVTFRSDSAVTIGSASFVTIQKTLSGNQQIAASAQVTCSYSSTTATSVANTGLTVIPFPVKEQDTHSAYNTSTGIWTCPANGTYSIKAQIGFTSAAYAVTNYADLQMFKNGVYYRAGGVFYVQAAGTYFLYPGVVNVDLPLVAGDQIQFKAECIRTAGATVLSGSSGGNYMSITRIGN